MNSKIVIGDTSYTECHPVVCGEKKRGREMYAQWCIRQMYAWSMNNFFGRLKTICHRCETITELQLPCLLEGCMGTHTHKRISDDKFIFFTTTATIPRGFLIRITLYCPIKRHGKRPWNSRVPIHYCRDCSYQHNSLRKQYGVIVYSFLQVKPDGKNNFFLLTMNSFIFLIKI